MGNVKILLALLCVGLEPRFGQGKGFDVDVDAVRVFLAYLVSTFKVLFSVDSSLEAAGWLQPNICVMQVRGHFPLA